MDLCFYKLGTYIEQTLKCQISSVFAGAVFQARYSPLRSSAGSEDLSQLGVRRNFERDRAVLVAFVEVREPLNLSRQNR